MSEENKENMQQNEGVKINIKSPEAEVAENAEELQEAENQAEETDMGGGEIGILKKQGENYRIFLNKEKIPSLELSRENLPLLTQFQGKEESGYLKEQYNRAKMFLKNVGKREETLFAVTEALVERQEEFFEKGRGYLRPMNLMDIAQGLNMHESTVSRAVKDKYLECR